MSPITLASRIEFRKPTNDSWRRRYTQSTARPTTVNSEFQYVHETAVSSRWRWSTKFWNVSS